MKQAKVLMHDHLAGILVEDDEGYEFRYDQKYLESEFAEAISLSLPLSEKAYRSNILFPFFDGLIPEGWLLELSIKNWKIDSRDRMSLLLVSCKDCIGAVSIEVLES